MKKKLFYQIFIYGLGGVIPKFISYFFLKMFTSKLNYNEYSTYTDMYIISFFMISLLTLGIDNAFLRYSYLKVNKKIIFSTCSIMLIAISVIFLLLGLINIHKISTILHYKNNIEYCIIFLFIIFFDIINIMPLNWLRKNNMPLKYSIIKIINVIIHSTTIIYLLNNIKSNSFFPISLIKNYTNTTGSIFYSNLIVSIINTCMLSPIYLKTINIYNFDFKIAYKMLHYGIPVMISNIAFCINENLDKFIIKRYISSYQSGGYSAGYKIATCISLYVTSFKLGVEPYIFKKSKNKYIKTTYKHINYIFIIIGIIIFTLLCANLKIIYQLIINNKYNKFLIITPIIMLSNFLFGVYHNMSISYKILNKPFIGTIISLIGVIVTIIFNIYTIIFKKIIISAIGTLCCYSIMLFLCYIWNINNYKLSYITTRIILHIILSIIISFFLFKTKYIILNILGQILYLIFIYIIENKEIKKMFKI